MSDGTGIDGYRQYLAERNGAPDPLRRRLERREEFFAAIDADPVRSRRTIDPDTFSLNLRRRHPNAGLGRELAWLLATAKLNQAERFGVGLGETYGRTGKRAPEAIYLELEEHYHTRLLAYVLDMFDLPFQVVPPPLVMRQFVKLSVFLPERPGLPFVGAAEMAGCVMFDELRRAGVAIFADEPDVAARIDTLYREILTDELGHVGYCAARCSPAGRMLMRRLYPRFGRLFARQTSEILLVVDRHDLHERLDRPFDIAALTQGLSTATFVAAEP
ncbi:MAG TPA: hypothetical protein VKA21_12615 [Candidatus Binatia bacterium]|nr:hypothetical protein [Candidatus Binatia bacterium]